MTVVERDYPDLYDRFTSIGPLMEKLGNGGKGIGWNTEHEVEFLARSTARAAAQHRAAAARNRHRRHRSDPEPCAGNQRRGRGEGVARRSAR